MEVELADGPERVLAWVPGAHPGVVGATHYRADGRVIPDRFVRAMATAAGAAGAQIHEQVAVFGLERSGARVSAVLTSRGVMRPQTVVLATGFLSRQLARGVGLRLPIIGRARGLDNLVLATGHGMIGVSLAPISGKVAAEAARGEPPSLDLGPLRADRY